MGQDENINKESVIGRVLSMGVDPCGKDKMQDRAVREVELHCSFMLPCSEPKRLSFYQLLGCQGRARSWMRWTSAAETALLELIVLTAVGMVSSSLRGDLSRASLCPSQKSKSQTQRRSSCWCDNHETASQNSKLSP